jgi:hypothetical protein
MMTDTKASTLVGRSANGRFVVGHRSRGGRGKGSRSKLSEKFLADLHAEWQKTGRKVLADVAQKHPETFLRVVSAVLPRVIDLENNVNITNKLTLEIKDFREAWEQWGKFVGAAQLVEIEAPEDNEADDDQHRN